MVIIVTLQRQLAVVALPNCHWTDGSALDLERIAAECHLAGVPLVLDVTQSAGGTEKFRMFRNLVTFESSLKCKRNSR